MRCRRVTVSWTKSHHHQTRIFSASQNCNHHHLPRRLDGARDVGSRGRLASLGPLGSRHDRGHRAVTITSAIRSATRAHAVASVVGRAQFASSRCIHLRSTCKGDVAVVIVVDVDVGHRTLQPRCWQPRHASQAHRPCITACITYIGREYRTGQVCLQPDASGACFVTGAIHPSHCQYRRGCGRPIVGIAAA